MTRIRSAMAVTVSALAIGTGLSPQSIAQPLPGGSVSVPPIEPVAIPVPAGSTAATLPTLPFPLFWHDPVPPPPRFVASNWVEAGTWCPAPNQWAYSQNGTKLWCVRLQRTDGYMWAPHQTEIPNPRGNVGSARATSVGNSLGGKVCDREGQTAVDPSNGQPAYCGLRLLGGPVTVWMYEPGS